MKMRSSLIGFSLLTILCVACQTESRVEPAAQTKRTASPPNLRDGMGIVRAARGQAQFSRDGLAWQAITVNQLLRPGWSMRTEAGANIDLFLGANGVLRLLENSDLRLDEIASERTDQPPTTVTRLTLRQGKVLGHVHQRTAASVCELHTPKGVLQLRGSDYSACDCGAVLVKEGTVSLRSGAQTYVLKSGEYFDPEENAVKPLKSSSAAANPSSKCALLNSRPVTLALAF